ncbi:MAG: PAS domain S-box protein [Nakamurella sp.]
MPVHDSQFGTSSSRDMGGCGLLRTSEGIVDELQVALTATRQRLATLFEATPAALAVSLTDSGVFEFVNQAMCDVVGYGRDKLLGHSAAMFMHQDDAVRADALGAAAAKVPERRFTSRTHFVHRSGRTVIVDVTLAWIDDDGTLLMLAQMVDVSRYMAESEELRIRSETEALTGLPNGVHLTRALAEMGESGSACAVLFLDLDGFKPVNDTCGHAAGDEVQASLAGSRQRAQDCPWSDLRDSGKICAAPLRDSSCRRFMFQTHTATRSRGNCDRLDGAPMGAFRTRTPLR